MAPTKAGPSAADAVRTIDSEIEQHEQEILALKTRRNTYAPISRLPPELISRIFECYKKVQSQFQYSHPLRWIRCTHVCRLWRTIALDSPLLWADLDLKYLTKYLTWAKESLIRSKMAPLKVSIHLVGSPDDDPTIELAKDIIRKGSRLKDVIIYAASRAHDSIEDILRSLPRSTQNLQSLEIMHVSRGTKNVCLPSDCICEAEKLQRLRITGCGIDWVQHLSNKSALTVLRLDKVTNTSTISMPQFLQCLAEMPSIRVLELNNAFPTLVPHRTNVQSRRIPLPSLRLLRLQECPAKTLGSFFKHIALGNRVVINIESEGTDELCFTSFLEEISSVLSSRGPDSPIRSLRISRATSLQLAMGGYSDEVDEEAHALDQGRISIFFLRLTISSVSSTQREALWINACAALPFQWVRSVCWITLPDISVETITACFGILQNLESLTFCSGYPDFDVDKTLLAILPSPEGTWPRFAFPKLRHLTLYDFTLDSDNLTQLIGLLIQRYEGGSEVRKLVILECYGVDDKEIGLLREVVTEVVWDGIVLSLPSDSDELTDEGHYETLY